MCYTMDAHPCGGNDDENNDTKNKCFRHHFVNNLYRVPCEYILAIGLNLVIFCTAFTLIFNQQMNKPPVI